MIIHSIDLNFFRNYKREKITLSPGLNIFTGKNAQGKTNLLEAIYLCSVGKSPRTPRDKEMINSLADSADIRLDLKEGYIYDRIEILLSRDCNKRIAISGIPISRIAELMGVLPTVFFSPDELKIVKNSPADRRRFMDISLCQISRSYFYILSKFNNVLSQRNKILKDRRASREAIEVWNIQLAEYGAKIAKSRKGFIKLLDETAKQKHLALTGNTEHLSLTYEGLSGNGEEEIKAFFLSSLKADIDKDIDSGYTHTGPHKDDINISTDNIDLRSFGSQGQQRTAALSMKLAEMEIMKQSLGRTPVLLLDDVLSELDIDRCNNLFKEISDYQAIVTCTEPPSLSCPAKIFEICAGKVIKSYEI